MFDSSSYDNPTPLAHADTSRDVFPRGGTSQWHPTRLEPQVQDYVEVRNPQTAIQLLEVLAKFEERYSCKATLGSRKSNNVEGRGRNERRMSNIGNNRGNWRNSEVVHRPNNGRNDYRGSNQNNRQGNQWFESRNRFQNEDRRFNYRGYQFRNRGQNEDFSRGDQRNRDETEIKQENWKKYYNRCRRDVQIKANDWVWVAPHHLSSATRKEVAKFKPKFEGPYRVLDVKNNNVVIWKSGKRLTINVDQVRIYRHRKSDETEIGTGSSDNGSLRDGSSGFDRVQQRSNDSRDGKKKGSEVKRELEENGLSFRNNQGEKHTNKTNKRGPLIRSIPRSWSEKDRMIKKGKNQEFRYKRANESWSGGPERKVQKGSEHRVNKRVLSSNYKTNHSLKKYRKKSRREETVTTTTSGYNLRPRIGKREESRPTIERKTQQGGPS
ncbi:uncharacterized protein TNCV_1756991 [Trichonephila clavipes]|nr:uncharacterized protein TNCV_1756991 [Trichonephila clavipes]